MKAKARRTESTERALRYRELLRQAARQFRVKETNERARHVATLRLAREYFLDRLVVGRIDNPDHLLKLDAALTQDLPQATSAAPAPAASELPFRLQVCSKKIHSVCQRCGHIQPTDEDVSSPKRGFKPPEPLLLPAPSSNGAGNGS